MAEPSGAPDDNLVRCAACGRGVHYADVADVSIPELLRGDSFFEYRCSSCTGTGADSFIRGTLSWPTIVHLVLFHLHVTQPSQQFFALREDICSTIDKCWDYLQSPDRIRPVTWINSVAAALSTKHTFRSGTVELGMTGFWALRTIEPPILIRSGQPNRARNSVAAPSLSVQQSSDSVSTPKSTSVSQSKPSSQHTTSAIAGGSSHSKGKYHLITPALFTSGSARTTPVSVYWPKRLVSELAPGVASTPSDTTDTPSKRAKSTSRRSISDASRSATDTKSSKGKSRSGSDASPNKKRQQRDKSYQGAASNTDSTSSSQSDSDAASESDTGSHSSLNSNSRAASDANGSDTEPHPSSNVKSSAKADQKKRQRKASGGSIASPKATSAPSESARTRIYVSKRFENKEHKDLVGSNAAPHMAPSLKPHDNAFIDSKPSFSGGLELGGQSAVAPLPKKRHLGAKLQPKDGAKLTQDAQPKQGNSKMSHTPKPLSQQEQPTEPTLIPPVNNHVAHVAISETNAGSRQQKSIAALQDGSASTAAKPANGSISTSKRQNDTASARPRLPKLLSAQHEFEIKARLDLAAHLLPAALRRFRRKLLLRAEKRVMGQRPLDIDAWMNRYARASQPPPVPVALPPEFQLRICMHDGVWRSLIVPGLTPAQVLSKYNRVRDQKVVPYTQSLRARLYGSDLRARDTLACLQPRVSPFTGRRLEQYILRDRNSAPPQLLTLEAIAARGFGLSFNVHQRPHTVTRLPQPLRAPIDLVYFHETHLSDVNRVLSRTFWPGIDVCENLLFPDFGVVALYKRLVVGCAFMTPEGYITYLMVCPGWDRCGIATRMLFHLIQKAKSASHDATLHVAANNPAMLLYQKFGFKPEGFVVGFYDKYLPSTTRCTNAIFMRLRLR